MLVKGRDYADSTQKQCFVIVSAVCFFGLFISYFTKRTYYLISRAVPIFFLPVLMTT